MNKKPLTLKFPYVPFSKNQEQPDSRKSRFFFADIYFISFASALLISYLSIRIYRPEITVVSSRPLNEASNGPEKKDAEPKKHRPLTKSKSVAVPPKPHEDTLIVGVDIPPPPSTSPPPRPKSAVPPSTSRRNSNKAPRPRSESFSGFESGDYFDSKDSAMEKDSCQEKELHLQLGRTQSLHSPREPATLPKRIPVRPAPAPPQRNVSLGGINQPQLSPTRPAPPLPLHKSQRDNTNQESTTR